MTYTTIEANVEDGVLKGSEVGKLPSRARVLVTYFQTSMRDVSAWETIRPLLGQLTLREDTQEWQRRVRDSWE